LSAAGAVPFETRSGEFEPQSCQFVGPFEIAPRAEKVTYSLITHWSSADHFNAWKASGSYHALQIRGRSVERTFRGNEGDAAARRQAELRDDKLQREWTLDGHP
jgi:hypothetical protein